MPRLLPFKLGLMLSLLALAACNETTTPTPAGTAGDQSPAAALFPFPPRTWTGVAQMPMEFWTADHPFGSWRFDLAAGVVNTPAGESTVYVLGGRFEQAPTDIPATTVLAYDVTADRWTTKAARYTGAGTNGIGKIGGKLYISGGADFAGKQITSRLFAYDPVGDRMIRKADMPEPTGEGVTGVIGGKLYVLAGRCLEDLCRKFYRYDAATNVWTALPPAPKSHRRGAGAVLNGKFYVAGGGSFPFRAFDVYDPATNAWQTTGLMPPRRQFAVGTAVGSRFYVIGIEGADRLGSQAADRHMVTYEPSTNTWRNTSVFPGPTGDGGQFLLHPWAAVPIRLDGRTRILTLGSGHLFTDPTVCPPCLPAGTIYPTLNYVYTP